MRAIGIDTHKATLVCCLIDELGSPLDERTFANDAAGHRALPSCRPGLDRTGRGGGLLLGLQITAAGHSAKRADAYGDVTCTFIVCAGALNTRTP